LERAATRPPDAGIPPQVVLFWKIKIVSANQKKIVNYCRDSGPNVQLLYRVGRETADGGSVDPFAVLL
jgi:hypothetical protein